MPYAATPNRHSNNTGKPMVDYRFSAVIDERISFSPVRDTMLFDTDSAANMRYEVSGTTLIVRDSQNRQVIFDATPELTETMLGLFTPANTRFADGSIWAVGDLSADDTLDSGDNTLDFISNPLLSPAFERNNHVVGLDGNDTINLTGSNGNHMLRGGSGNDTIRSGNGNSTLFGGETFVNPDDGNDTFIVGSGSNVIYGNGGDDAVTFSLITFNGNETRFFGGEGNDTLTADGLLGSVAIYAGPGDDQLSLTNSDNLHTIFGGNGGDTIDLTGSDANLTIIGGDAIADADDGGDAITMGGGASTLYANGGADSVLGAVGSGNQASIFLGAGADEMASRAVSGTYLIHGGPEGDVINLTGHTGNSTIFGGNGIIDRTDGADTIISGTGDTLIYGNAGADEITVRPADGHGATVFGGAGNDTIVAAGGGSSAIYSLHGNTDDDTFQLNFATARPTIHLRDFGTGSNTVEATLSGGNAAGLTVTREATSMTVANGDAERIVMQQFTGNLSEANFVLADASVLLTNFGREASSLNGTDQGDHFIAGDNGDTIIAGAGGDRIIGGSGNDRFEFSTPNFDASDTILGGGGVDVIALDTAGTTIQDFFFQNKTQLEQLLLTGGDYSTNGLILGSSYSNSGIQLLDGSAATAITLDATAMTRGLAMFGSAGDDRINATNHYDIIVAGAGNDTLTGNRGNDVLRGGEGEDVFVYVNPGVEGVDVLDDIDFGTDGTQVDRLQFSAGENNYDLGNNDAVVDGTIITSITNAGANLSEVIILRTVGIREDNIVNALDIINFDVNSSNGVLNVFFNTTLGHAVLYYDTNSAATGGHTHLASFTSITSIAQMNNIDFNDFVFV